MMIPIDDNDLDVPEGIPEGLYIALLAYAEDPTFTPPQGSPGLRAMVKLGGQPLPADFDWIDRQYDLQDEANEVLAQLEPMPTPEQILNSPTEYPYPGWVGTPWSQTLMMPWSQDMETAIEEGRAYVSSKAGT